MIRLTIAAAVLALGGLAAQAAPIVKVSESVKVAAAPAQVWEKIGHFSNLTWHPAIKSSEASEADKPGSQRRLDLGGPILWEQLVVYRPAAHSYTYKILDNGTNQKVLPVMHYISSIVVKPDGKGSEVVWSSTFTPAPGTTADAAHKAIAGVYRAGLDALAKDFAKN
ncbi:SRPBCC family protein [Rhodoblastus acidophilus]|uniref:SRPBCC family protein n=1 Tax=Candidatus Rhodoblastus alkanivorans TaxID=2954117 RepID=A0ABS9Z898_9HYPH|nr:SRPBCC family protein [Candidatus Rhodoblastus alkanivorans]MCI4677958.1 SRPBCC family protein [Candidatus Rhodoblastus alkanivorans]MCI4683853.1 SRPBCC family protein [Candidatus Rhodoblastus alkanivorans]MDI4641171.1 SRPBCC family protein [Rhodoblastus acidophilus]